MSRTLRLYAAIEFEHDFEPNNLEPNLDGIPGDIIPTDEAMQSLIIQLDQALRSLGPKRIELDLAGPIHDAAGTP